MSDWGRSQNLRQAQDERDEHFDSAQRAQFILSLSKGSVRTVYLATGLSRPARNN